MPPPCDTGSRHNALRRHHPGGRASQSRRKPDTAQSSSPPRCRVLRPAHSSESRTVPRAARGRGSASPCRAVSPRKPSARRANGGSAPDRANPRRHKPQSCASFVCVLPKKGSLEREAEGVVNRQMQLLNPVSFLSRHNERHIRDFCERAAGLTREGNDL